MIPEVGGPLAGAVSVPLPEWYDELDVVVPIDSRGVSQSVLETRNASQALAYCFLRVNRLQCGAFDLLTRYETALWRQAAQLLFMLQTAARR